jgi:DNA-binding NarL/FixJ family response regulator
VADRVAATSATAAHGPHSIADVAVVAGSGLTRAGIAQVLERCRGLRVTAAVTTSAELIALGQRPDLIVWDQASNPGGDPTEIIGELARHAPVLVIAGPGPATDTLALLRAGARSLVTGHASDTEFLAAVEATSRGIACLTTDHASQLMSEFRTQQPAGILSRREIETLRLIADGYTHRQVARRLGLTEETVNTYVKRIRGKLNAGNKAELTRMAIDLGYTTSRRDADPRPPGIAAVPALRLPA